MKTIDSSKSEATTVSAVHLKTSHILTLEVKGASETGTPILGIFNISHRQLTEIIPLSDFSGVIDSLEYVVRAHTTGLVSTPIKLSSPTSFLATSLDVRGYEIFSAFPLKSLPSVKNWTISIGNLGLLGKMTGCAAITSNVINRQDNGRILIDTSVKAFGILGKLKDRIGCSSANRLI